MNKLKIIVFLCIVLSTITSIKIYKKIKPLNIKIPDVLNNKYMPIPIEKEKKEELSTEPIWINWEPVRSLTDKQLGNVLLDIESHMPSGHVYTDHDKVTWAHETTHGINAKIRIKTGKEGYYCLKNRAAIMSGPKILKSDVNSYIPKCLIGDTYNLYINGASTWNTTPLYLCDEWISYTNGSEAGLDLAELNLWGNESRSDTILYMLEFDFYILSMINAIKDKDPNYFNDDNGKQFISFVKWNIERSLNLVKKSKSYSQFSSDKHDQWISRFQSEPECQTLRNTSKEVLGADWCKKVLSI